MKNQPKQGLYNNDSEDFSSDLNHHISNSPHDNKTKQVPVVVVKSFVNLRRAESDTKKMLRTMLLAVVLLEMCYLLESL
ncbi:conjugal transfer protein TraB [Orientia tsutsugamushi]|uniref:conjugal transfer protein TraB n=1 Tax=Orientia tsutsugamushi TaxID=784 RepID=UPI00315CEC54